MTDRRLGGHSAEGETAYMRSHVNLALLLLSGLLIQLGCADATDGLSDQPLRPDPAVLDFGEVLVGTVVRRTVHLENRSLDPVTITRIAAEGTDEPSFTFEVLRSSVEPGQTLSMDVVFAPTAAQSSELKWRIETNPAGASTVLTVRGRGTEPSTQGVLCDLPSTLSFGNVVIGSTKTLEVPLCNLTDMALNIELLQEQNVGWCNGGDPATFCWRVEGADVGADGSLQLSGQQTITLQVDFRPVIAGTRERGTLGIRTCESTECDRRLRLDGLGVETGLRCSPLAVDFGAVSPGRCLGRQVLCENQASLPVRLLRWGSGADVGLPTDPAFRFDASAPVTLDEGQSQTIEMDYCPTELGAHIGALYIETDQAAPAGRVMVDLRGIGGGPNLVVQPETLDFGLVSMRAGAQRSVLITNTGDEEAQIVGIQVDAGGTGAFASAGPAPATLAPGESLAVQIEFLPRAAGPASSRAIVSSSDLDQPELSIELLGEGVDLPPCAYRITPTQLEFGQLRVQHVLQRVVEFKNVGTADCLVYGVELETGTDPGFSLGEVGARSQRVGPGESLHMQVTLRPMSAGSKSGSLELSVSAPSDPNLQVILTGQGVEDGLLVAPNHLDFGTQGLGCHSPQRTVRVHNPGAVAATITSLSREGGPIQGFSLVGGPALPLSIPPGGWIELNVSFFQTNVGLRFDGLQIEGMFEGRAQDYRVALTGQGDASAEHVEDFDQLANHKVDMLFVIDNSGSTANEQARLAEGFPAVTRLATESGIDFQLGVTTTDTDDEAGRLVHPASLRSGSFSGPFADRIITPSTLPTPDQRLAIHVQAAPQSGGGSSDEAGFFAAYQALSPPMINGHNSGFVRADAALTVLFMSDEPEQSFPIMGAPTHAIEFYLDAYRALKGPHALNRFSASAIGGDEPAGCSGPTGAAAATPRYNIMGPLTGGVSGSVCSTDWYDMMAGLAPYLLGMRDTFFLENPALANSISVEVDGASLPAVSQAGYPQWSHNTERNAVVFSPFSIPEFGAQIRVRYRSPCL